MAVVMARIGEYCVRGVDLTSLINQDFPRRRMAEKVSGAGRKSVGPRHENSDDISNFGTRQADLIGKAIKRGAKAANNARDFVRSSAKAGRNRDRVVSSHNRTKIA